MADHIRGIRYAYRAYVPVDPIDERYHPHGVQLGEAIRTVYQAMGSRQIDIAEALGVDQTAVSKWCQGKVIPPLAKLWALEDYLGLKRGTILAEAHLTPETARENLEMIEARSLMRRSAPLTEEEETLLAAYRGESGQVEGRAKSRRRQRVEGADIEAADVEAP